MDMKISGNDRLMEWTRRKDEKWRTHERNKWGVWDMADP